MSEPKPFPNADAERLAQALVKVRSLSHELNQPVQVIVGTAELLLASLEADDPLRADLARLAEQAERLIGINQRLSRVAKLMD